MPRVTWLEGRRLSQLQAPPDQGVDVQDQVQMHDLNLITRKCQINSKGRKA